MQIAWRLEGRQGCQDCGGCRDAIYICRIVQAPHLPVPIQPPNNPMRPNPASQTFIVARPSAVQVTQMAMGIAEVANRTGQDRLARGTLCRLHGGWGVVEGIGIAGAEVVGEHEMR